MTKIITFLKKLFSFGKDVVNQVEELVEDVKEAAEKHDVTVPDLGLKREDPKEPKRVVKRSTKKTKPSTTNSKTPENKKTKELPEDTGAYNPETAPDPLTSSTPKKSTRKRSTGSDSPKE